MTAQPARPRCSATVITLNEELNIGECLESLRWADEIIVVDSGSRDRTVEIARGFTDKVFTNPWPGHKEQKNFAVDLAANEWIFSLDADERVGPALREQILGALGGPKSNGYLIPRNNYFLGRLMRHGGWHPDEVLRLFRKDRGRFGGENPHDKVVLSEGKPGRLAEPMTHYTYRSFGHFISKQQPYAEATARSRWAKGKRPAWPVARVACKPAWKFVEVYLLKLGLLDGVHGLVAAFGHAFRVYMTECLTWEMGRRPKA